MLDETRSFQFDGAGTGETFIMTALNPVHHRAAAGMRGAARRADQPAFGTLSVLAVGFLVASAKTAFVDAANELKTSAARLVLLDRILTAVWN
ncbi:hypothetical protein [Rhizobium tibeticum]|uniref:hypothetical protein n=1 Tax=Rhizobium tibeticum TaxID=501024 RepID=UPI001FCCD6AC|nr:hypothetical protein [Rhizobium tibeticum]